MADREYIIEVLLKARDEMSAAFAKATAEIEAYKKELEKQKAEAVKATVEEKALQKEMSNRSAVTEKARAGEAALTAEMSKRTPVQNAAIDAEKRRVQAIDQAVESQRKNIEQIGRSIETGRMSVAALNAQQQAHARLTVATGSSEEATRRLHLELEKIDARYRQSEQAIRAHAAAIKSDAEAAITPAAPGGRGPGGPIIGRMLPTDWGSMDAFSNFVNKAITSLSNLRASWQVVAAAALGPGAATLVMGMAGAFIALGSAVGGAATAIGVTFVSAMAQGIPAMGLFTAAMGRLQSVMGVVQTLMQQPQAAFIARYTQQVTGINQVTLAQHQYVDALFAQRQAALAVIGAQHQLTDAQFAARMAVFGLSQSELGLRSTRQQATRQLQDLIFQETQARLAAQASSLAVGDAQRSLLAAMVSGGNAQQLQLQLAQAQAGHAQSVAQAQRAITDARPGSIARQQIAQQVQQASLAVTQARHAVTDAQFAVTQAQQGVIAAQHAVVDAQFQALQARAAIKEAELAMRGTSIAMQAQLAWLRSQMTATERSLVGSVMRILQLFRGSHAWITQFTDPIVRVFKTIADDIYTMLHDPRIMAALHDLSSAISSGLGRVVKTVFDPASVRAFAGIIHDSAANIRTLAAIVADVFRTIQAVVVAAAPALHGFLGFIRGIADEFAKFTTSAAGQNFLKKFFDDAFKSLEAFIRLFLAIGRLFLAIAEPGGGLARGIGLIDELTRKINNLTDELNHRHSRAWRDLQAIFNSIGPTLRFFSTIFGAIGRAILQLGSTRQGRDALQAIADLIAHILVPALVQAILLFGHLADWFLRLYNTVPGWMKTIASNILGVGAALYLLRRPLKFVTDAFGLLWGAMQTLNKWVITPILEKLGLIRAAAAETGAATAATTEAGAGVTAAEAGAGGAAAGAGLLGAGAVAGGGTLLSQLVGGLVGGTGGGFISSIGTGASLGAGLGMLGGPFGVLAGAAGGAILGGAFQGISDLLSGRGINSQQIDTAAAAYGKRIGGQVTSGFNASVQQQFQPSISAALARANRAQQMARQAPPVAPLGSPVLGGYSQEQLQAQQQAQRWASSYSAEAQRQMQRAGTLAGQAFIQNFQSVRHPTVYGILQAFNVQLAGLPKTAKEQAALTMLQWATTLQQEGKLPKGALQTLIKDLEKELPGFRQYMKNQGYLTAKDFATQMNMEQAQKNFAQALANITAEWGLALPNFKRAFDPWGQQMNYTMNYLRNIIKQSTGQQKQDAENYLKDLVRINKEHYGSLVTQTQGQMDQYITAIRRGNREAQRAFLADWGTTMQRLNNALAGGLIDRKTYDRMVKQLDETLNKVPVALRKPASDAGQKMMEHLAAGWDASTNRLQNAIDKVLGSLGVTVARAGRNAGTSWITAFAQAINAPGGIARILPSIPKLTPTAPWLPQHQTGGPIGGFGSGDIVPALLEPGEHVITKKEVQAAGGHSAIFAFRRALGGGGQGGPFGYQTGGATSPFIMMGLQTAQGQTAQGVTGLFGSVLANIIKFIAQFEQDWKNLWPNLNDAAANGFKNLGKTFSNNLDSIWNNWWSWQNNLTTIIQNFWKTTNNFIQHQLNTMVSNFKSAYQTAWQDTFQVFWSIAHAANQALKAFGAKPVSISLGSTPKLATGGYVGQPGERGSDVVPVMLGRGEAVLNYAHQGLVEPALRAYYGFGLDKLFRRTNAEHAAGSPKQKKIPHTEGFQRGGYVFPFPKGQGFTWGRVDQGQDLQTNPGGLVVAIAPGVVSLASDTFGGFGPHYATQQITSGPLAGRGIYYGHIWATRTGRVNPGDVIGRTQPRADDWTKAPAGWLEIGFLPYGSMSAGYAIAPLIHQLAAGHQVTAVGGGLGAAMAAVWKAIHAPTIQGSGVLADTLRAAAKKVTDAANAYGQKQAGLTGTAGIATGVPRGAMSRQAIERVWIQAGGPPGLAHIMSAIAYAESSGIPSNVQQGQPYATTGWGLWQITPGNSEPQYGVNQQLLNPLNNARAAVAKYRSGGLNQWTTYTLGRYLQYMAKGGIVGGPQKEGEPQPIVAHVGEWVLNKSQQNVIASALGTSVDALKQSLGFRGGPYSFANGGEIGYIPGLGRLPGVTGAIGTLGGFSLPTITADLYAVIQLPIATFIRAQQRIVQLIRAHKEKFVGGMERYIKNLTAVTDPTTGLFAIAANAITDYINSQQAALQLAEAGVRRVGTRLRQIARPLTAVAAATADVQLTNRIIAQENALRSQEQQTLNAVNARIETMQRQGVSRTNRQFQALMIQRADLVQQINTQDQNLAQAYSDLYTKQVALFQARTADMLRNLPGTTLAQQTLSGTQLGSILLEFGKTNTFNFQSVQASFNNLQTVLSQVGPSIATGLAQLAQTVAQAYGDPNMLQQADQAILNAAQQNYQILFKRYEYAAAQAQRDPRWQAVADQALSDLENAASAMIQAEQNIVNDFNTRVQLALRGTATLTGAQFTAISNLFSPAGIQQSLQSLQSIIGTVGPTIAQGLLQMMQSVAQTLGDPKLTQQVDQLAITTAQNAYNAILDQYTQAAALAQTNPMYRTVADQLLQQLEAATIALAQAQAQALTDAISALDVKTQIQQTAYQAAVAVSQAIASITGALGPQGQYASIAQQIQLSQQNAAAIQGQIGQYQTLLSQAQAQGNITAVNQLTQTITNLNTTMVQANVQTQQLITSYYQLAATLQSTFTQTSTGWLTAAAGIFQTIGQIVGNQQLPQLIQNAQLAGQAIRQAGQMAVQSIQTTIGGAQGAAFGAQQATAVGWLNQATAAFQQGSTAFATWLETNSAAMAQWVATLPTDQQALFNSLIQSLVDNTTAQVQNTLTLQQLNASANQQAFSSTAWQMFRDAIFNGLGGLLPQYSMTIPKLQTGGILTQSGLFYGHAGEAVLPAEVTRNVTAAQAVQQTMHFNITNPTEVADPNYLGNAIAWRIAHNPNLR